MTTAMRAKENWENHQNQIYFNVPDLFECVFKVISNALKFSFETQPNRILTNLIIILSLEKKPMYS